MLGLKFLVQLVNNDLDGARSDFSSRRSLRNLRFYAAIHIKPSFDFLHRLVWIGQIGFELAVAQFAHSDGHNRAALANTWVRRRRR